MALPSPGFARKFGIGQLLRLRQRGFELPLGGGVGVQLAETGKEVLVFRQELGLQDAQPVELAEEVSGRVRYRPHRSAGFCCS
jgi:hypothetical protein